MSRPKEDLTSLPDHWKEAIIELYKEGASDVEVKALIFSWRGALSNGLWERWMEEEEEFSKTIKEGKLISQAWWQKKGRTNLHSKDFNPTLWYMNMKNRFNWADKQEIKADINPLKAARDLFPTKEELLGE